MNINKWQSRIQRLIANPKQFARAFYHYKVAGILQRQKRKASYKEYFDEITLFAQNYQVNSMRIGSEYVWPYLRNHMWVNMSNVAIGKIGANTFLPWRIQSGHYSQIPPSFRKKIKKELGAL